MCLTKFLNGIVIMQDAQEKADLQKTKVNATKIRKVRVDRINFVLGKNGGCMPSSLGARSIVVIRHAGTQACIHVGRYAGRHTRTHTRTQADEILAIYKILKFDNFNSKARLGCLNGFMVPIASYQ